MQGSDQALRPLGLGEVLDRAVTLCVKNFVPLALIFIIYAIPYAIVQHLATRDLAQIMATFQGAITAQSGKAGGADPAALSHALSGAQINGWYPLLIVLVFFVGPLPAAALIEACAAAYFKRPMTLGIAYRVALKRWLPLIGINVLYLGAGLILYVLVVLLALAIIVGLVLVTAALHAVGVALAVLVGAAVVLAGVAFFVVATLAVQISYFTCVLEGAGTIVAFAQGLRRVFFGVGLARSLLVGMTFFTIGLGIGIVALLGQSIVVGLSHSTVAGTIYVTVVRIATAAFTTAFIAIFYYDLRVREDGFDLELAADAARDAIVPATT